MQITVTFDPSTELDNVQDILDQLKGEGADTPAPAPAAKAPAKKAAPAKRAAAKPAPEPEPEEEGEDAPTLEDAIARAQELVGEKRTDEVKAAVKEIGVERVSKLKGRAQIERFLELVADDADDAI